MSSIFSNLFGQKSKESGLTPSFFSSLFSNYRTQSGKNLSPEAAKRLSAAYACRKQISESMSLFPVQVIKKISKNQREVLEDHPVNDLFNLEVNPVMTSVKFFQSQQLNILDYGNSYAEIQFEKGTFNPIALWPIPAQNVTPKIYYDEQGINIYYEILLPNGKTSNLPKEKILHIVGMSENGFVGEGVIQSAANSMGLGSDLESYAGKFFTSGSAGGGYVTLPGKLDPQASKNLRTHLEQMNSGLENAHRFKFLYDGATYTPDNVKPDQAQFLESRTFQVQEIARFYGMPLHKIQENSKGSYNSYEQMAIEYITYTLAPFVRAWEQEIKRKLFRDSKNKGLAVKFNLNALLRGDSTARANFYRTMVYIGVFTRNEIRAMEDLNPKDGADDLLVPTNLMTQEQLEAGDSSSSNEKSNLSDKALDGKERTID